MGVPALFRWLSAKYPKIVESVVEVKELEVDGKIIPVDISDPNPNGVEFDNLYLDMNGIIHPCCHPENQDAPPTEQDMMVEIFKYIDRIMGMVRPRKLLYLAIDGVAPRAKMNQQRSRRFRAAMEARQKAEALALENEEEEEDDEDELGEPFDSNCITPGTPFMKLVSDSLKYYTVDRINNHPAWRDVKVIFSDASVPGEGEHKIMDFIRRQRLDPSYDPNTKHVIYGLDADLIMLSMATHEPYFKVLREDVFAEERNRNCRKCGQPGHYADSCPGIQVDEEGNKKEYKLIQKPFIFLDIPTLREYLEAEMKPASSMNLPYKFNADRVIDDWIFLCFFVGNDFLPHLPSLEIREGAIDVLIDIYKQNAVKLGGYICKDGVVNLERVELIMEELGKVEDLIFRKRREKEERRMENAKRRRTMGGHYEQEIKDEYRKTQMALHQAQTQAKQAPTQPINLEPHAVNDAAAVTDNADIVKLRAQLREQNIQAAKALKESLSAEPAKESAKRPASDALDEEPADNVRLWEPGAKDRYYRAKFHIEPSSDTDFIRDVAKSYVEGLCWVMAYYYQGCPSWKWFYPYHYAPFASDLSNLKDIHVRFELGEPFRPFDQLMGVFPAASSSHIPEPFRPLMTEPDSEVIDFYPETFHIDMNGKRAAWQGVALLPFIDEERLLKALEKVYPSLTPEQIRLNARGDPRLFSHCEGTPKIPGALSPEDEASLVISMDPSECGNIAGMVKLDLDTCSLGGTFASPLDQIQTYGPVSNVQVRCFHFQLPYHERRNLHFRAQLLPGVRLPERRLTEEDRYLVQSGQASKSFNSRLVLGPTRQHHHSMHQEYNQAQERRFEDSSSRHRPQEEYRRSYDRNQQQPQYGANPYAVLAPTPRQPRPEEMYPPPMPPQHLYYQNPAYPPPHMPYPPPNMPYPPPPPHLPQVPQPASSAFHRPQPPKSNNPNKKDPMDDLYGLRRR